jgi:hypothetical protein
MQKIFIIRHMSREAGGNVDEDFKRLVNFILSQLGNEKIEVYCSLEDVAYNTSFRLTTTDCYLRRNFANPKDNHLLGIGVYGESHFETFSAFPLFELTTGEICKEGLSSIATGHFGGRMRDRIRIPLNEESLDEALVRYSKAAKPSLIPKIVGKTSNSVLLITHSGILEGLQCEWRFPRMKAFAAPYLSGSVIIPSQDVCREFGPVTRYEVTKEVRRTS